MDRSLIKKVFFRDIHIITDFYENPVMVPFKLFTNQGIKKISYSINDLVHFKCISIISQ